MCIFTCQILIFHSGWPTGLQFHQFFLWWSSVVLPHPPLPSLPAPTTPHTKLYNTLWGQQHILCVYVFYKEKMVKHSFLSQPAVSDGVSENEDSLNDSSLGWTAAFSPSESLYWTWIHVCTCVHCSLNNWDACGVVHVHLSPIQLLVETPPERDFWITRNTTSKL